MDWFQSKLIEHIVDGPNDDRELKIEETFEIQMMLEMQLLGITVKKRLDFSYLLHRYGKDLGPEVIKTKKFTPARLKDILESQEVSKDFFHQARQEALERGLVSKKDLRKIGLFETLGDKHD